MATARAPRPTMTLAAWGADDDIRDELVDGVLVEGEMPTNLHELVVSWLFATLSAWGNTRGATVYGSDHKLGVAPRRGRRPDVTMHVRRRRFDPTASMETTPPDVVVEVISPSPRDAKRDRIEKPVDYARFGIRWYWLVDPAFRTFEILELRDGAYALVGGAGSGSLVPPGCRGLSLDLDALWSYVDERTTGPRRTKRR